MLKLIFLVITILILPYLCAAYKILVAYPFPAKSHNNLGNGVVKHLLRAGHEVTYITPFPLNNTNPNLHQVDVSSVIFPGDKVNIYALMHKEVLLSDDNSLFFAILPIAEAVLKTENVQNLLNDPQQKFDVVVAEWMFNELYAGLAVVFDCPYIWTFPYEPYANILGLIDEPPNPAYIPNIISDNVPPFNFIQRGQEWLSQMKTIILKEFYHTKLETEIYEEIFTPILAKKGKSLPSYEELRHNASMIFGNSHVSMGQPMRLPQNFKIIAGYYIDDDVKPLPDNLQKLMDNAKHGVIYFSMGSNLKSNELPETIKRDLIKMFGELKEEVLWKFEAELAGLPKNIHIVKWAPQQSVLAHRNCKLFISHGGLLSTTEAVHFGVPIIGIPVFVDQFNNVDRLVQKGAAKRVDISYSLANDLKAAIKELTSDFRYTQRARELSMIYHDRPVSPGAELVHWVEHVVRTRGAPHLRSPALLVPWYQKMYLDFAILILSILILLKIVIKYIINQCSSRKMHVEKKKKK